MPVIEVYRKKRTRDILRSYRVIIDGREVGRLRRRQTGRYQVEPGHHLITIGIDWCSSEVVGVELAEQESVRFSCEPAGSIIFARSVMHAHPDWWIRLQRQSSSAGDA
jgi:hypothetical protein